MTYVVSICRIIEHMLTRFKSLIFLSQNKNSQYTFTHVDLLFRVFLELHIVFLITAALYMCSAFSSDIEKFFFVQNMNELLYYFFV